MFLLTVWIFHLTFSPFFMTDAVVSNSSFTALRLSSDIPCYSGLELKIAGWKLSIYSLYFIPFHGLFLLHVCAVDISNVLTQILGGGVARSLSPSNDVTWALHRRGGQLSPDAVKDILAECSCSQTASCFDLYIALLRHKGGPKYSQWGYKTGKTLFFSQLSLIPKHVVVL